MMPTDWKAEAKRLRSALEDIAHPLVALEAEAKSSGASLNGCAAMTLCDDAQWLRSKAREALAGDPHV